jgi:hypothetical protein
MDGNREKFLGRGDEKEGTGSNSPLRRIIEQNEGEGEEEGFTVAPDGTINAEIDEVDDLVAVRAQQEFQTMIRERMAAEERQPDIPNIYDGHFGKIIGGPQNIRRK